MFLIIGLACIYAGIKLIRLLASIRKWPSTKGTLIEKYLADPIQTSKDCPDDKRIFAKYNYTVDTAEYEGTNVYAIEIIKGERMSLSRQALRQMEKIDNEPTVYYNPDKPTESFLIADSNAWRVILLVSGILCTTISLIVLIVEILNF